VLVATSIAVAYASLTGGAFRNRTPAFAAPITGLSLPGVSSSIPTQDQTVLRGNTINRTGWVAPPITAKQQEAADQMALLAATPTSTPPPPPAEDAPFRAVSVAPPPDLPPYQVYKVEEGDTVSSIATRFALSAEYITANNIEIRDSDFLTLGQSIIIPAGNGILHEVRYGETLSDIATRYDVGIEEITAFTANHIATADDITEFTLDGTPVGGDKRTPYLERFIHGAVFEKRPKVTVALHAHTESTLPFGITGVPLRSPHGLLVCRKPVVDFAANCAPRHDCSRIHTWR